MELYYDAYKSQKVTSNLGKIKSIEDAGKQFRDILKF